MIAAFTWVLPLGPLMSCKVQWPGLEPKPCEGVKLYVRYYMFKPHFLCRLSHIMKYIYIYILIALVLYSILCCILLWYLFIFTNMNITYIHMFWISLYIHVCIFASLPLRKARTSQAFSSIHINIQPYPAWLKLFASWSPNSIYRFTPFIHIPSFGVEPRWISNKRSSETTHADFDAQIFLGLFAFWIDEVTW